MDLPDKTGTPVPPKKKVEAVISGATPVKRPATRRFFDFVFAESPKALASKIGRDVIVPRLKAGFEEAANSFLSGMLWGDATNRPMSNMVRGTVLRGGMVNYSGMSTPNGLAMARQANMSRVGGNYQDLVVPSQQEAEILLGNLYDLLNQYRVVTVADLYEAANVTPQPSDNSYGWTALDTARISKDRDGYRLELPRPVLIG